MDPMPVLTTTRLHIRPFTMDDLDVVHHLLDVELAWEETRQQRHEWLAFTVRLAEKWSNPPLGYRAICRRDTQKIVGKCGFFSYLLTPRERSLWATEMAADGDPGNRLVLGIGYGLERACRGSGYGGEAVHALCGFAFDQLRISDVWARTTHDNAASRRLMERIGMRTGANPDPERYPGVLGRLTSADWDGGPQTQM